jgi:hypothetical protein
MNKEQAEQRIAAIEQEAKQLRELLNQPEEKKGKWKPEEDEDYWLVELISSGYDVEDYSWQNDKFDLYNYLTGNCFKTEQEAEAHAKRKNDQLEMLAWIDEKNGDWEIDWEDRNQKKYYAGWIHDLSRPYIDTAHLIQNNPNHFYLKSEELAQKFIATFGDRIKNLYV